MLKLIDGIVELFRKVATSIPPDVESALKSAFDSERLESKGTLSVILENIKEARQQKKPVCQELGVPVFWVRLPRGLSQKEISSIILKGTEMAVSKVPLYGVHRMCSSVKTGMGFLAVPVIYYEEYEGDSLSIDLMLKGADCENTGSSGWLPGSYGESSPASAGGTFNDSEVASVDTESAFNDSAPFSQDTLAHLVTDTILKAQGKGCPPYTVGIGISGARDRAAVLSKSQLLRKLNDVNPISFLQDMESKILSDINRLKIGPLGLGGNATALGVKLGLSHWHPSSNLVDVSVSCWALRRGRLIWN
ncbi:MAG: fumarate hydratase [Nitrospirae bacterium]|nr:fumarate hydratase [Nitrospirota bacterium]